MNDVLNRGRNGFTNPWTSVEIELLKEVYTTLGKEEILTKLSNRTWTAIKCKANQVGQRRQHSPHKWTPGELEILKKAYPSPTLTKNDVEKMLTNHNWRDICQKARRTGLWSNRNFNEENRKKRNVMTEAKKKQLQRIHDDRRGAVCTWRDKIGEAIRGNKRPDLSALNKDPEFIRKRMRFATPNKAEKLLDSLLQDNFPGEWRFVGDGKVIIDGLCPDFINCNGKKKIIELFGEYWHKERNIRYNYTEEGRTEIFGQFGYGLIVIWSGELKDPNAVIEKIAAFMEN